MSTMAMAKLLGKRTHQVPGQSVGLHPHLHPLINILGRLIVSELFFEVPKNYNNPLKGSLRLFARSVERFEKPVDSGKNEKKQPPWCMYCSLSLRLVLWLPSMLL